MEEERDKIHLHVTGDGENLIDFSSENDALVSDLSSPLSASGGGFSHHQTHHQSSGFTLQLALSRNWFINSRSTDLLARGFRRMLN